MMHTNIPRVTALLVIEVVNSNPNGDPDHEGEPRQRPNGLGEISPVSFKRKLRDLVENEGPVVETICRSLGIDREQFRILESKGRRRSTIQSELGRNGESFSQEAFMASPFVRKYWDGRLFGNTFLEAGGSKGHIKTGVAQFTMGLSVAPVVIRRHTITNKAGVVEGRTQGMAPLAYRVVEHGVYYMPFYINPSHAHKSGCSRQDVDFLKALIPYAYDHTRSAARPDVRIRHAWYMEHNSPLGSCADWKLIEALTPKRTGNDPLKPSQSWSDYLVPTDLPLDLKGKVIMSDLMEDFQP
jgi:Cas7 group CRISPR-associated protein Csh2